MRVAALFAGIGGLERGLAEAGHETIMTCEIWEPARAVLENRFATFLTIYFELANSKSTGCAFLEMPSKTSLCLRHNELETRHTYHETGNYCVEANLLICDG